ncbi:hypothetical protein A2U01_0114217, partial [Trifolium medium]|nr:hypothetical protein [Trifolium medium]
MEIKEEEFCITVATI